MNGRCTECGEIGRLNAALVCAFRGACEHRQLRHEAEMGRLYAEMARLDPLPCGHSPVDHDGMWADLAAYIRSVREGYSPDAD